MAISKNIWNKAKMLFEYGNSLAEISKETSIDRSTISKKAKEENWERLEGNQHLIQHEADTTIIQHEINHKKSTLNQQQLNYHNQEVYKAIVKANALDMFDNVTIQNQIGINTIQNQILEKELSREDIFDLGSISKVTETNRKQIFGATDTYKPESKPDESRRIGLSDLYKDINND